MVAFSAAAVVAPGARVVVAPGAPETVEPATVVVSDEFDATSVVLLARVVLSEPVDGVVAELSPAPHWPAEQV